MSRLESICNNVTFVAVATVCFALGQQAPAPKSPGVNADAVIIGDFDKQVKEYVKLHKKAEAGLPALKPTDSPHTLNERRRLLASRIQTARAQARQGDLFSPQVGQLYKRLIVMAYQASGPAKVAASLRHDEPVHELSLQVNAVYPETVPLQTTPPSILTNLPPLPPELDYRIVGRNLVLRDTAANIIVDYLPAAIPPS
jgi:hypothetical protein